MLDDVREWLSDNLRYILLGLAALLLIVIIFCVVRLVTGCGKSSDGKGEDNAPKTEQVVQEQVTEGEESAPQTVEQANVAESSDLVRDDAAILTLVQKYYTAAAAKDTDTLSQIVTPWNDAAEQAILSNDVIESYNNITTYSKKGLTDGSYVVYVYYDVKLDGMDTLVPSLSMLYVVTDENNTLKVSSDRDSNQEVQEYLTKVSADADVQALIADVNKQYEALKASDDELAAYLSNLEDGSDSSVPHEDEPADEQEEENEDEDENSSESREMTATAALNIRQEPSTEAAIVGTVIAGTNVTVLEEVQDGWCRISYTSSQGTIEGYVKLEYLTDATETTPAV